MKTTRRLLLSICAAIATSATSQGAFTLYTDYNSFTSAISLYNPGTISFSNIPTGAFPNASYTTNGYTMNASSVGGLYGETYVVDPTIRFLSVGGAAADDLVMTFSTNVYAVGGWFMAAENNLKASSFTATIVAGGITNIFTNNTTTNNSPSVNYDNTFLGWLYDTNIASLTLSTDPGNVGFPTAANQITLAVPEPSTYALLALSAAGLAGYVIRRRRS
jgi:hypothetical protein